MQLTSSYNIDYCCYCKNWLVHANLDKTTKNFKIEKPKLIAQKSKALNNFLRPNQDMNNKTSNKARKKNKKYAKKKKQKKNSNVSILVF